MTSRRANIALIFGANIAFPLICTTVYRATAVERSPSGRFTFRSRSEGLQTLKKVVQISAFRKSAPPFPHFIK